MKKLNALQKLQKMTSKQIVESLIKVFEKPITELQLDTFGRYEDGVCYACAATNLLCKLSGVEPSYMKRKIAIRELRAEMYKLSVQETNLLELALNYLRTGFIVRYNEHAAMLGIAQLPVPEKNTLPPLEDYNYEYHMQEYKDYAKNLK